MPFSNNSNRTDNLSLTAINNKKEKKIERLTDKL